MADDEDVRDRLERLATRRRLAAAEHREASRELRTAILDAQTEGMTMVEIARLAGISRRAAYKMLERDDDARS